MMSPRSVFSEIDSDTSNLPALYLQIPRLPSPQPIASDLVSLGVVPDVAQKMSLLYSQRAEALKAATEAIMRSEFATISRISTCTEYETLLSRLFTARRRNYEGTLRQWFNNAASVAQLCFVYNGSSNVGKKSDSWGRMKSPRQFKSEYLTLFEYAFSKDRFPSREDKKHLARISGMTYRQVSVWFQNRRCRTGKTVSTSLSSRIVKHSEPGNSTQTLMSINLTNLSCVSPIGARDDKSNQVDVGSSQEEPPTKTLKDCHQKAAAFFTTGSFCRFPDPYKSSTPLMDPFTIETDSSLWNRKRGRECHRVRECIIKLDEVIHDMETMIVASSYTKGRFKSLPKRPRTFAPHYSPNRSPLTFSGRRTVSSSTISSNMSELCMPSPILVSDTDPVGTESPSASHANRWKSFGHYADESFPPVFSCTNSSSESLSSTYEILELNSNSSDYGQVSAFFQKGAVRAIGLQPWTSGNSRSSLSFQKTKGLNKLLEPISSPCDDVY